MAPLLEISFPLESVQCFFSSIYAGGVASFCGYISWLLSNILYTSLKDCLSFSYLSID